MSGSNTTLWRRSRRSAGEKVSLMHNFVRDLSLIMAGSAAVTTVYAVLVRLVWRRGKKLQEL
jgi:hypothetical protein